MSDWQRVRYDEPAEGVARITLARPEAANAPHGGPWGAPALGVQAETG